MPPAFSLYGTIEVDTRGFQRSLNAAEDRLKGAEKAIGATEKAAQRAGQTNATVARSYEKLTERIGQQRDRMLAAVQAYKDGAISQSKLASVLRQTDSAVDSVNSKIRDSSARLTDWRNRLSAIPGQLQAAGQGIRNLGTSLTVGLTVPLLALGKLTFDQAAGFDAMRNKLTAVTGSVEAGRSKFKQLFELAQSNAGVFTSGAVEMYAFLRPMKLTEDTILSMVKAMGKLKLANPDIDIKGTGINLTQLFTQQFERPDLKEMVGKFPRMGEILQQAFSLSGSDLDTIASEMKAKLAAGLSKEQFFSAIADALQKDPALNLLGETIGTRMEKMKERIFLALEPLGVKIAEILGRVLPTVVAFIEQLSTAFSNLSPAMQTTVLAFAGIATVVGPVIVALGALVSAIGTIAGAVSAAGGLSALAPILAGVGAVMITVAGYAALLYAAWQSNFGGIRDLVQSVAQTVSAVWASSMASISDITQNVTSEAAQFWAENGEDIKKAAKKISDDIKAAWAPFAKFWAENQESILEATQAVWSVIKSWVVATVKQIGNALRLITAIINGDWAKAWESLKDMVGVALRGILSITAGFGRLLVAAIKIAFSAVWNLGPWILAQAFPLGSALGQGLINGLSSMASSVAGAVSGFIARNVVSVAQGALLINSPSLVFVGFGKGVGEGFIVGVQAMTKPVQDVMKKMVTTKTIEKQIKDEIKELQKALSESLNGIGASTQGYGRTIDLKVASAGAENIKKTLEDLVQLRIELSTNLGKPLIAGEAADGELKRLSSIKDQLSGITDSYKEMLDLKTDPIQKLMLLFANPEAAAGLAKVAKEIGLTVEGLKNWSIWTEKSKALKDLIKTNDEGREDQLGQGSGRNLPESFASGLGPEPLSWWDEMNKKVTEDVAEWRETMAELLNMPKVNLWADFWGMMKTRLEEFRASLPSVKQALGENLLNSLEGVSSMLATNLLNWEGGFKGFFTRIGKGFADMARQIAQEMLRLIILNALLKIFGGALSGAGGGGGAHGPAVGGGIGGPGPGGFASGGYTGGGSPSDVAGVVHKREYVFPYEAVKYWGLGMLERMKSRQSPGFMSGGFTGGMMPAMAGAGGGAAASYDNSQSTVNHYHISVTGGGNNPRETASMISRALARRLREDDMRTK